MNSGPQMHYVLQRAFDALELVDPRRRSRRRPRRRLVVDESGELAVDEMGIARGGVRTPWVDVPVSILSGLGQPGEMTELFGTTRPLDPSAFATRYPRGRDDYVAQFAAATRATVDNGFLLAVDAPEIEALGALAWPTARS